MFIRNTLLYKTYNSSLDLQCFLKRYLKFKLCAISPHLVQSHPDWRYLFYDSRKTGSLLNPTSLPPHQPSTQILPSFMWFLSKNSTRKNFPMSFNLIIHNFKMKQFSHIFLCSTFYSGFENNTTKKTNWLIVQNEILWLIDLRFQIS
jgi:hypothetical protein